MHLLVIYACTLHEICRTCVDASHHAYIIIYFNDRTVSDLYKRPASLDIKAPCKLQALSNNAEHYFAVSQPCGHISLFASFYIYIYIYIYIEDIINTLYVSVYKI